jgi:hypothetical protein
MNIERHGHPLDFYRAGDPERRRQFIAWVFWSPPTQEQFNAELPAYRARARELMKRIPSFFVEKEIALPTFRTRPFKPPPAGRKMKTTRANPLQQTPEQVQAERQRIADRASARLEALGPRPDLAGLSISFNQDSNVMRAATRYVDAWEKKRAGIERWRYAPLRDDVTEEIEQAAFEESLGSLKLLKKEFDDAQQEVIDRIVESYYASLQAAL